MKPEEAVKYNNVDAFIDAKWDECIVELREDRGSIIGLPYPYSVPSTTGNFKKMYYWDTYFTNIGLLKSGKEMIAKFNTDNIIYLVDKFGFMPNINDKVALNRSQPPFLSEMVRDVYEYYKDPVWLRSAYYVVEKEYEFWMTNRITPCGLNQYNCDISPDRVKGYADGFEKRIGMRPDATDEEIAVHAICTSESGWDMTPRWGFEAYDYAQVDLNCLLYMLEKNMTDFSEILGLGEENKWINRANKRRELMCKFMEDENGVFFDYNFKENSRSEVFSIASVFPMYSGLADEKQAKAIVRNLFRLEEKFGISTCEKGNREITYQWDYPNGWSCLQYVVAKGLINYGYSEDGIRVAEKYISATDKIFEETNNLWEKYNVTDGTANVVNEYDMPWMLGWTAGVYKAMKKIRV